MSLTTQNWRYVGSGNVSANSIDAVLAQLYTLGISATYADMTTRTPGTGSAWTWSRFQIAGPIYEACYATPPTDTLNQRIIFAGSTVAKTPLMAAPDVWITNYILAGHCKNAGAFASWDHASQPFTSGNPFGYWRAAQVAAMSGGKVHLYECQESVIVLFETVTGTIYFSHLGAFVDPESTEALDAESDGKLYGMSVTGGTTVLNIAFWAVANSIPWTHNVSNGNYHCAVYTPGAGTLLTLSFALTPATAFNGSFGKLRSGRYARLPVTMRAAAAAPNDNIVGRLREVFMFNNQICNTKQTNAGTTIGFCIGGVTTTTCHVAFLLY